MAHTIFIIPLLAALLCCAGTKAGAYRVFAEDLERLPGKKVSEAYEYNIGRLNKIAPDSVKTLVNGNEIRIYSIKPPRRQICSVHIEVSEGKIINATSEGPECWRAY